MAQGLARGGEEFIQLSHFGPQDPQPGYPSLLGDECGLRLMGAGLGQVEAAGEFRQARFEGAKGRTVSRVVGVESVQRGQVGDEVSRLFVQLELGESRHRFAGSVGMVGLSDVQLAGTFFDFEPTLGITEALGEILQKTGQLTETLGVGGERAFVTGALLGREHGDGRVIA